jgi:hypothetical protein
LLKKHDPCRLWQGGGLTMSALLIVLLFYFAIGVSLAATGQIFAPPPERSVGGFLIVATLWPAFVIGIVLQYRCDEMALFRRFSSTPRR